MSCNPTIAGKVPPTRIPPPICASALGSQLALNSKTVGAANDQVIARLIPCATAIKACACQPNRLRFRKIRQRLSLDEDKSLNLRNESKSWAARIFRTIAQKKFIIRLHFVEH
jgi:hypothetical protein